MKIDDCVQNVKWIVIVSVDFFIDNNLPVRYRYIDFGYLLMKNYQPTIIKHLRLG